MHANVSITDCHHEAGAEWRKTDLLLGHIGRDLRSLSGDRAQRGKAAPGQRWDHTLADPHLSRINTIEHKLYSIAGATDIWKESNLAEGCGACQRAAQSCGHCSI
jgi:hypothetical protein